MTEKIRTWHAPDANPGPPPAFFKEEPQRPAPQPAPEPKKASAPPQRTPEEPRRERPKPAPTPDGYLSSLAGKRVAVSLLATGEDLSPVYATLAGVRKYEVELVTEDGRRLIIMKTAVAMVEVMNEDVNPEASQ
jgi:hypothetical protein